MWILWIVIFFVPLLFLRVVLQLTNYLMTHFDDMYISFWGGENEKTAKKNKNL